MSGVAPNNDTLGWVRTLRLIGQRLGDQAPAILRGGFYGETIAELLTSKQQKLAGEGSLYATRTPTPGTGVASITTPTAYVTTSPYIIVTNNNPPGGKDIWLDMIKLNMITPGTSSTNLQYTTVLDSVPRYSSGGSGGSGTSLSTILQGPLPLNSGAPAQSSALVYAGALVAVAPSPAARVVSNGTLRSAIAVALDTYHFNFGSTDHALDIGLISGAAVVQRSIPHPAVCIAPGGSFLLHLYGAAMAAATTCEVEIYHVER